ncbi:MAG: penicillin acylase family protein [Chloroflexi bacterium]|uniref:Penicillin acylase family protein n=1 Tax=Candidatus Chlorohelix allophototropha TaxID=3003348 RepID=A0A8T7M8J6_9CHLR|nr:penicillin acylase family protein [Chloroflexota bacterium]WJW68307.1 penicillin acylase family protein [Chloroflexota bacterium L227-S17]
MAKQLNRAQVAPVAPKKVRSRGKTILRFSLFGLLSVVVIVIVAVAILFYWLLIRPQPETNTTLKIPGLTAEVKVVRDKAGVPHIYANNLTDLFIAQGYVTAQDRLWQLEFNRRVGSGRLSEVLGSAALDNDKFLRTIGLRRAAEQELPLLAPEARTIIESYSQGINAFIDTHKDNLPIEFTLLGFTPEPWTPLDSVTWGKVMAYDLGGNYTNEILRAALVEKLGEKDAALLLPLNGAEGTPLIVPNGVSYVDMEKSLALVDLNSAASIISNGDMSGQGSNNWVVGGTKTTTGKPMLANDPHLGIRNPSVWYEVSLHGAGFNVAGVTFPGVPGVVIGHNDRIAWGVTNVGGDTQDLFMEKINPANANQYEFQSKFEDMSLIKEEIKVKGKATETITVRVTRHGPIMNDVVDSIKNSQYPMALEWVALQKSPLIDAVLKYNRANNWNEFREGLKGFNIAGQNFVFADVDGNIGYQLTGLWPTRAKGDGLLPVPGWNGDYEWTGFVPFEQLPSVYNPPNGFIVTANQRPANMKPGLSIGEEFDPGWRAQRITDLLQAKEKLSLQDLGAIQFDTVTLPGKELAKVAGSLQSNDSKLVEPLKRLREWDGNLTADSSPGALYKVTYQYLLENMFKNKMGDAYERYIGNQAFHVPFVIKLLKDPQNAWWGEGGRDAMLLKSLGQAVDYLNGKFGSNINDWKWGKLHTLSFTETPIGDAAPFPLNAILNLRTLERAGDGNTVNAASYRYVEPYKQSSGASFRELINLASFDDSLITNTIGQSGQPFNSHYGDNIDDWQGGKYHPFLFSSSAVDKNKEAVLTLGK